MFSFCRLSFSILLLLLSIISNTASQTTVVFKTSADTVWVKNAQGDTIVQFFWYSNPLIDSTNNTILITEIPIPILPPHKANLAVPFGPTLFIEPKTTPVIRFGFRRVTMRLFGSATSYRSGELYTGGISYNIVTHRHRSFGAPLQVTPDWIDTTRNFLEFTLDSLTTDEIYATAAVNILNGEYPAGSLPDSVNGDLIVPAGAHAVLHAGTTINTRVFATVYARGTLECLGTQNAPVTVGHYLSVSGDNDSAVSNSSLTGTFLWTTAPGLSAVNSARVTASFSTFNGVYAGGYSRLQLRQSTVRSLFSVNRSFANVDSCTFKSGANLSGDWSFVTVSNSLFENFTHESSFKSCYLGLFRNMIHSDAFLEPIQPQKCLMIYDGNTFRYSGTPGNNTNKVGISVYSENHAIIKNNVVIGFRNGVEIGYGSHAVIYNNTFADNDGGIKIYGVVDSVAIYNNIFTGMNYGYAVDLHASTGDWKQNRVWIGTNLWNSTRHPWGFINSDTTGSNVVNGKPVAFANDPLYENTTSYTIPNNSPAVDKGNTVIHAFPFTFHMFDSTIVLGNSILLDSFYGAAPDLGAREYHPQTAVHHDEDNSIPGEFILSQNYPNPCNPSTTVSFALPEEAFVTLKIFDITGREAATLISETLPAGTYSTPWNAAQLSSGVYLYRLQAGRFVKTMKMAVVK